MRGHHLARPPAVALAAGPPRRAGLAFITPTIASPAWPLIMTWCPDKDAVNNWSNAALSLQIGNAVAASSVSLIVPTWWRANGDDEPTPLARPR